MGGRVFGLRPFAERIGADHLLDIKGAVWEKVFLELVDNPSVKFSINIDGWWGSTAKETIENMMKSGDITGWEVKQLLNSGRLGGADIYWNGKLVSNPYK